MRTTLLLFGDRAQHLRSDSEILRMPLRPTTSEIAGDVIAALAQADGGFEVTIEITFRTKGMLSAMFFPAIRQALASGFPQQVEDLVTAIQAEPSV